MSKAKSNDSEEDVDSPATVEDRVESVLQFFDGEYTVEQWDSNSNIFRVRFPNENRISGIHVHYFTEEFEVQGICNEGTGMEVSVYRE